MVFKRRKKRALIEQVRDAVYPRKGWRRAFEYIGLRIKRLPDTPHKIALGFSCGVIVSFSPFFGFHFVYAGLLAMLLRGNLLASLLGTFFGNPLTFPFIAAISYRTGQLLLGHGTDDSDVLGLKSAIWSGLHGIWHSFLSIVGLSEPQWSEVGDFLYAVFFPYLLGGIIPGIIAGIVSYILARPLVAAYQMRRRAKFKKRAEKIRMLKMKTAADPAK